MKVILRIARIALRHRYYFLGAYLATVGATIAYLLLPRYFGKAVDQIAAMLQDGAVTDVPEGAILTIALIILGLSVIRGALSFFQTYLAEAVAQHVAYDIRNSFYDHVQHMSFAFHDRQHTGNLMSRAISDVENIRMFISMGLVRAPYFLALFVIVAGILIWMDWKLGLVSTAFMPAVAWNSAMVRARMRQIWLRVQEKMGELNTVLQENLTGVRVVKAFGAQAHEEEKYNRWNAEVAQDMVSAERLRISNTSFTNFTFLVAMMVILWFGGWQVIRGDISPGELAQFIFYMQILAMPVRMSGMIVNAYARAASAGQRLFEVLDAQSPVKEQDFARVMPRVTGDVRFENVELAYDGQKNVLRNISFRAEPGKVVALLGAPGSGKSSIANLLPRFYDVTSGRITIDGIDIRDVTLASLRKNIGIVQQDVFLFTDTVRANIAYGREGASLEEVIKAAKVARLHDFIMGLPDGYDTLLSERGANLSGGQRQRMAIARAVLLDPPVLILDDSTSSVDARTENEIRTAMVAVMEGRTTFIIAHRLGTVHRADMILVLKDGEIVERGTHNELLAMNGLYREIYELQLRPQEEVMREVDLEDSPAFTKEKSSL